MLRKDFIIQAGGYDLEKNLKPTYKPIINEANLNSKAYITHEYGTVAMARLRNPDSASS